MMDIIIIIIFIIIIVESWSELKSEHPSIPRAIWSCHKWELVVLLLISTLTSVLNMVNLTAIGILIDWFGDNSLLGLFNDKRDGFILVLVITVLLALIVYTGFLTMLKLEYIGFKIRTQCTSLLYKKVLRLNSNSEQQASVGKVINVVSNDLSRVNKTFQLIGISTQFPVVFAFTVYQVYRRMDLAVLVTLAGIVLFFIFMMWQAIKIGQIRTKIAAATDKRCKAWVENNFTEFFFSSILTALFLKTSNRKND